jgi:DNA-directed RNA polymerase beta subunit
MMCESSTAYATGSTIKIKKPTKKSVKISEMPPVPAPLDSHIHNDTTDVLKNIIEKEIRSVSETVDQDSKHILSHLGEYIEEPYTIIESYFGSQYLERLVRHQIESYNHFINFQIQRTIQMFNPVTIHSENDFIAEHNQYFLEVQLSFDNFKLYPPQIHENNGATKVMLPQEAKLRNFTYASTMTVDVHINYIVRNTEAMDTPKIIKKTLPKINIGKMPIMIKSSICVLSQNKHLSSNLTGECSMDCGGYFVVKGSEKTVLGQERAAENKIYCFDGKNTTKWNWFAEIKSVPDFKCISPKQIEMMIASKNNGFGHGIYMTIPRIKQPIELFVVFRALGITTDKDICQYILLDVEDETYHDLLVCLQASIIDANKFMTQEDALRHITSMVAYTPINMDKETGIRKKREFTLDVLNNDLFPHCKTMQQKLYLIGYMANKLIQTSLGWLPPDDRDSYLNKRIELTGTLLNNLFRNYFNKLVKEMQKQIVREINTGSWRSTEDYENIINMTNIYKIMKSTTIENGITRALSTGDFSIKQSNSSKVGVAQVLNRLTYLASLSHLRRINTPLEKSGELIAPRKLHNTTWGMLCPCETPEGQSIGIVKNISYLTHITIPTNSSSLYEYVQPFIEPIETISPPDMKKKVKVFVNGAWLGITQRPMELYQDMKDKKYRGIINIYTSVTFDFKLLEIRICNDGGRLTRPVLKVRNNKALITLDIIQKLEKKELTWNDLLTSCRIDESVIEYIDPDEQNLAMIAMKTKDSYLKDPSIKINYTHCEIHPSTIFGVLASCIPFPEHNQAPRNTYQCCSVREHVYSENNSVKQLNDVKVGDKILTFHPETLETTETLVKGQFVQPSHNPVYELATVSGRKIIATSDHTFMTDQGWKTVDDMILDSTIRLGISMKHSQARYLSNKSNTDILLTEEQFRTKLSDINIVDNETKYKVTKWSEQLKQQGLLPLYHNNKLLPILARIFGSLSTDASFSVINGKADCTFCMGRENDAIQLQNDMSRFGFPKNKISEIHRETEICGRFQTHHVFNVSYHGCATAFLLVLGAGFGRKTETPRHPIPEWIINDRECSREFLRGFQGGDGCKIRWNKMDKRGYNFVCAETSQQISYKYQDSLVHFMDQCVTMMRSFGIDTSDVKIRKNKNADDRVIIAFKIADKYENLIRYFDEIGYAYAETKFNSSFQIVEYLKAKKLFTERHVTMVSKVREIYDTHVAQGLIENGVYAPRMKDDLSNINIHLSLDNIRDMVRSYKAGRKISTPDLNKFTINTWLTESVTTKNGIIFVPIASIKRVENQLVSCIETESDNHSFITTHGILSKNCAMSKQAIGVYAMNYDQRMDKTSYILTYPSRSLVDTRVMNFIQLSKIPSGSQIHVAIMTHTGYNQEDSVLVNKGSIDRGLFSATIYHTEKDEDKNIVRDEIIRCKPDKTKTKGIKFGNYDKLDSQGFIPENSRVENRDVIIAKIIPIKENRNDPTKTIKYEDQSKTFRTTEETYIDKNYTGRNGDGYNFAKVRVRTFRKPVLGDKFSSRHGQKGTCGNIIPECDMPFTKNGLRPDIIINPHAIPSRMTIAQLKETLLGKVLLELGLFGDGTSFGNMSVHTIAKELQKLGYESYGNEVMYNGLTGEQLETSIFIGPVFYQRLKHMVNDKQHSRSIGPMVNLTRQPAEGRSRDGGFRIGEMERDVMLAHGMSKFCRERLYDVSDKYSVNVCKKCGMVAAYNDGTNRNRMYANSDFTIHMCKTCNNTTDFAKVEIPYAYKLLSQELQTINVSMRIMTE